MKKVYFFTCPKCGHHIYTGFTLSEYNLYILKCNAQWCNFAINYKKWCLQNMSNEEWVRQNKVTLEHFEDMNGDMDP